ncbi:DUF2848 family protein [Nocardia cyriacigeorgica]|uniref:Protein of uncharacterized function (DUF2848) n=1 Tax=Nocardia cyriacigeorgica TaxID=135487 RepID=A0A4U8W4D3_9NOCA|nr:DUF2848 family protein [Nocardia cyriacigeorgica]VFA96907.1 Protein of uncharacterised function (DUF2848) [Nocardia cyriacigeorgica]
MTHTVTDLLTVTVSETGETLRFDGARAVVAGYTGRDEAAVRHHIDELAAIGVAPPENVPMLYRVGAATVTSAAATQVPSADTSGEVEPVILRHQGRYFLGVGSDHTDRTLETVDIGESKRVCAKPIGPQVVEIGDWSAFDWDGCRARSWVDGRLYQDGTLAALRTPGDLLAIVTERLGDDGSDLICFAGTLPLLDGRFTPGTRWDLELTLPDGRALTHTYTTTEGE